jgi:hypothetical protein
VITAIGAERCGTFGDVAISGEYLAITGDTASATSLSTEYAHSCDVSICWCCFGDEHACAISGRLFCNGAVEEGVGFLCGFSGILLMLFSEALVDMYNASTSSSSGEAIIGLGCDAETTKED